MIQPAHSWTSTGWGAGNLQCKPTCTLTFPAALITSAKKQKEKKRSTLSVRRRQMDLEAVVCLYNGIWLHHKTEWTNAFVSDIDGPGDARTKWRKSEEDQNPWASLMGQTEKSVKMNSSIKQTHRLRKETSGDQGFKVGWRERETRRLGLIYNCDICKIDNPQGPAP